MKKSIRTKIMFFSGILILAVLLGQIVFNIYLSKPYFIQYKQKEIEKLFYNIKENYEEDPEVISKIIEKEEAALNLRVGIFSDEGVIFNSRGDSKVYVSKDIFRFPNLGPNMKNPFLNDDLFLEKPKGKLMDEINSSSIPFNPFKTGEEGQITLRGKFQYNGQWRYIVIESPVNSIIDSVNILTKVNVIISIVVLIFGVIGAFIFSRKFSKPIESIDRVARDVANLNFDMKADESSTTTELESLSRNINVMSEKLKDSIIELQRANEELQKDIDYQMQVDKMRREFIANVSHELKTPLCLLMMYSETLKNNVDKVDKDFYCDTIIEESEKLNDMVKSLLDISHIENGLSKMNMEEFDFSRFAELILYKFKVMFQDKGIKVKSIIEDNIKVCGDTHYLEMAMKNYITNAISHTEIHGAVEIKVKNEKELIRFSVFNEGKSIDECDSERIWESFYKVDKARVRNENNNVGLGLYIVKTIIKSHGGEYGALNRDGGVEFWFKLRNF